MIHECTHNSVFKKASENSLLHWWRKSRRHSVGDRLFDVQLLHHKPSGDAALDADLPKKPIEAKLVGNSTPRKDARWRSTFWRSC